MVEEFLREEQFPLLCQKLLPLVSSSSLLTFLDRLTPPRSWRLPDQSQASLPGPAAAALAGVVSEQASARASARANVRANEQAHERACARLFAGCAVKDVQRRWRYMGSSLSRPKSRCKRGVCILGYRSQSVDPERLGAQGFVRSMRVVRHWVGWRTLLAVRTMPR